MIISFLANAIAKVGSEWPSQVYDLSIVPLCWCSTLCVREIIVFNVVLLSKELCVKTEMKFGKYFTRYSLYESSETLAWLFMGERNPMVRVWVSAWYCLCSYGTHLWLKTRIYVHTSTRQWVIKDSIVRQWGEKICPLPSRRVNVLSYYYS